MRDVFSFKLPEQGCQIISYKFDEGVVAHATADEVTLNSQFIFLVNVPQDFRMDAAGFHSYVFYLDAEPIERIFLPQNYQLVYTDAPCGTFEDWAETVIQHLCGCLRSPTNPPFDLHDIAGVLLEVKQHRLQFKIVPFVDDLTLPPGEGGFNRLMTVVFHCRELFMPIFYSEELSKYDSLAEWVMGGAVLHPYEQSKMMFLGDKICADKPAICTKNPLIPEHLRAIY